MKKKTKSKFLSDFNNWIEKFYYTISYIIESHSFVQVKYVPQNIYSEQLQFPTYINQK